MADSELSRREFLDRVGAASVVAALPGSLPFSSAKPVDPSDWDLSWVKLLKDASDRAVVDAPGTSDFPLQLATRFLDNCDAAYGVGKHSARVVLNLRTRGIAIGMGDQLWERFSLGTEYDIKERSGSAPPVATHNPFLSVPAGSTPSFGAINDLLARKAILLVCDFAMGHLAERLAAKASLKSEEVHQALRAGLLPGAYAVPSGIFGLAKAQNSGCAFISGSGA
jgi:hypothetical protein